MADPRKHLPHASAAALAVTAASALLLLHLFACNGTKNAIASSTQSCSDLATARCAESAACAPDEFQSDYPSMATCVALQDAQCVLALGATDTSESAPRLEECVTIFSPDAGYACFDYVSGFVPLACAPGTGGLANGNGCAFDAQCESSFCALPPHAACGACSPPPSVGEPCAALSSCGPALTCSAATGTCIAPGTFDEVCGTAAYPCLASLACAAIGDGGYGRCAYPASPDAGPHEAGPDSAAGPACDSTGVTAPDCERALGLYCGPGGTCAAITYGAPGAACGATAATGCAGGTCTQGTCVAAIATRSAACDTASGPRCVSPLRCIATSAAGTAGTCELLDASKCSAFTAGDAALVDAATATNGALDAGGDGS